MLHQMMKQQSLFFVVITIAKIVFCAVLITACTYLVNGQTTPISTTCNGATGVCSGTSYTFPAGVNSGTAQTGANYGCLKTRPNPAWFFMQIKDSGSITITMSTNPARDIDFIMWGPFSDPSAPCVTGLDSSKIIDCSYSTATSEKADISHGKTGEYYVFLITNYSNKSSNISFSQTGGTGTSNCDILCNITGLTATAGACGTGSNLGKYSVSGVVTTFTPPTTGTLTVSSSCGGSVTFNAPFSTSISYTLPTAVGNGGSCTVTASFSDVPTCTKTVNYTAPSCCSITPGADITVCTGKSISLTATGTTGGLYRWSGPNGFTSTLQSPTIASATLAHNGAYNVYLINGACTTSVATMNVLVKPSPTASITANGPTTFCQNDSVVLTTDTGSGFAYTWRLNGNNQPGTKYTYSAKQSGSYYAIVSQAGCVPFSAISSTITVTVNALPTATITAASTTTFCQGSSVALNANTGTGLTYQWKLEGISIAGATNASYIASVGGNYTVVVTNANGCSNTSSVKTVTVRSLPINILIPGDSTSFCPGGSVILTTSTGTAFTYQWRFNGSNITGTSSTKTVSTAGNYDVIITDGNGCKDTSSVTKVTASTGASASLSANGITDFCNGDSVVLTANSGSGFTYQWKLNGNNISGATSSTYAAKIGGNYTVVVSQSGCTPASATSSIISVTVRSLPSATIAASGPIIFCQNDSVILDANNGLGTLVTYQWKLNGNNISGATNSTYKAISSGNYTVVVSQNGCSKASSGNNIIVRSLPTATINAIGTTAFCEYDSVKLQANIGSGLVYQWRLNGITINGATNSTYTAQDEGSYTVRVVDSNGCSVISSALPTSVTEYPSVLISANGPIIFCQGNIVTLSLQKGDGISYQWRLNGIDINDATDADYVVNSSGDYTVIAEKNGCADVSSITTVTVNPIPAPGKSIVHE